MIGSVLNGHYPVIKVVGKVTAIRYPKSIESVFLSPVQVISLFGMVADTAVQIAALGFSTEPTIGYNP